MNLPQVLFISSSPDEQLTAWLSGRYRAFDMDRYNHDPSGDNKVPSTNGYLAVVISSELPEECVHSVLEGFNGAKILLGDSETYATEQWDLKIDQLTPCSEIHSGIARLVNGHS